MTQNMNKVIQLCSDGVVDGHTGIRNSAYMLSCLYMLCLMYCTDVGALHHYTQSDVYIRILPKLQHNTVLYA
jgi:hypothetical protein